MFRCSTRGGGRAGVHELPFRPFRSTFRLTWVGLPSFTQSQEGGGGVHHLAFRHSAVPHQKWTCSLIQPYTYIAFIALVRVHVYVYTYTCICIYIYVYTYTRIRM